MNFQFGPNETGRGIKTSPATPPFQKLDQWSVRAVEVDFYPSEIEPYPDGQDGINFYAAEIELIPPEDLMAPLPLDPRSATSTRRHIFDGKRALNYSKPDHDMFSHSKPGTAARLRKIEETWARGEPVNNIELAFWRACSERQRLPQIKFSTGGLLVSLPESFEDRDHYLQFETSVEFMGQLLLGKTEEQIHAEAAHWIGQKWSSEASNGFHVHPLESLVHVVAQHVESVEQKITAFKAELISEDDAYADDPAEIPNQSVLASRLSELRLLTEAHRAASRESSMNTSDDETMDEA